MPPITNVDSLPGVNVQIQDQQLTVRPSALGTKVTIMGTTTSLALAENDPIRLTSIPVAIRQLRHLNGDPSELSMAVAEAARCGLRNIEVVKIATLSGEADSYLPVDRFDDLEATYDLLKLHDVDIVVPLAALDQPGLTGTSPAGLSRSMGFARQLGNFCYQATRNWNSCEGVLGVRSLPTVARDEAWSTAPTGDAGEWFDDPSLADVREWVKHLRGELGTEVDHTADNTHEGFIAGSSELAPGQVDPAYDGWALDEDGVQAQDRWGAPVDGYSYLSITAILARVRTDETQNLANIKGVPTETSHIVPWGGAIGYAALLASLEPHEAPTGRSIPGYSPSRKMPYSLAQDLLRVRMVTLVDRSGSFAVQSGMTGGYNASAHTRTDFNRRTTRSIMHEAVDVVRERGQRFIGKPISAPNLAALEADISAGLDNMKPSGAVRSYTLDLSASSDAQVLGEVNVELSLVIGHELTKINAYVQLQKPENL